MGDMKEYLFSKSPRWRSEHTKRMLWRSAKNLFAALGTSDPTLADLAGRECPVEAARRLALNSKGEYVDSKFEYTRQAARVFGVAFPSRDDARPPPVAGYPVKEELGDLHVITRQELELMWAAADERERMLMLMLLTTGWRASAIAAAKFDKEARTFTSIEKGNKKVSAWTHPLFSESFVPCKDARCVYNCVKRIARKAGIQNHKHIHPHAFRHTFARMSLNNNNDIDTVRGLLGHRNVDITQRYYVRERLKDFQERANLPWTMPRTRAFEFPDFVKFL